MLSINLIFHFKKFKILIIWQCLSYIRCFVLEHAQVFNSDKISYSHIKKRIVFCIGIFSLEFNKFHISDNKLRPPTCILL